MCGIGVSRVAILAVVISFAEIVEGSGIVIARRSEWVVAASPRVHRSAVPKSVRGFVVGPLALIAGLL